MCEELYKSLLRDLGCSEGVLNCRSVSIGQSYESKLIMDLILEALPDKHRHVGPNCITKPFVFFSLIGCGLCVCIDHKKFTNSQPLTKLTIRNPNNSNRSTKIK